MKSSISHLVKQTKNELFEFGIDYEVLLFTHLMGMGDIRNVPYSNEQECAMYSLSSEDSQEYINRKTFELSCIDKAVEVFLWVNLCDADAYLSFLYFSSLFCNFSTVYFVPCYSWENIQDKNYAPTLSLQQKVKLTKNDFEKISGEFEKIKVQDGFYRIALDGKIHIFNKDDFDDEVLSCVSSKFERDNKIVSRFYEKNKTTFKRLLSVPQLWGVLNGLIEKGLVETKFDDVGLWENEIRLKKTGYTVEEIVDILVAEETSETVAEFSESEFEVINTTSVDDFKAPEFEVVETEKGLRAVNIKTID